MAEPEQDHIKRDFRKLPPVDENVPRPDRISQTLARHANYCPRSAFLYLKVGAGTGHALDRGSVVHLFAERMTNELIQRGEPSLWAPGEAEDVVLAAGEVASLTKVMVDEILNDPSLGFVVPAHEADHARVAAYHLAIGWDVDMSTVLGAERLFVLDLPNGRRISGKVDLLTFPDPRTIGVTDYKTSLAVPTEAEFEQSFQQRVYAALALFGRPVARETCPTCEGGKDVASNFGLGSAGEPMVVTCPDCDGKGVIETELDPLPLEHVQQVVGRQIHPRAKPKWNEDGTVRLVDRTATWSRKDIQDFLHDLERAAARIDHGVETRDWPARHGAHCAECPAEPQCPLPRDLRRFAEAISTPEEAAEAMEWAQRMGARVSKTKAEVREFAKERGERGEPTALVVGTDVFDFVTSWRRAVKRRGRETDWEGLEAATTQPDFRLRDWLEERPANEYKKRPAGPGEIELLLGKETGHGGGEEGQGAGGAADDPGSAGEHGRVVDGRDADAADHDVAGRGSGAGDRD